VRHSVTGASKWRQTLAKRPGRDDHTMHTNPDEYDAIVVGARCAGAPTAMLLARLGHRVLLVDRSTFPSDTLSTLLIQPHGIAALDRWGLLSHVQATGCPPIEQSAFDFGPVTITGRPRAVDGHATTIAPRRTVLDKILVDAAAATGAEVREAFTVDEVVFDDDTVVGIRGHADGGPTVVERARVVIGADGHNSRIARAVDASRYRDKPVLENAFYTFWSNLPVDGMITTIRGDRGLAAIPTNDDLTLLLVGCPYSQAARFRNDVESNYFEAIARSPQWAERVDAATRQERFTSGGVPNFYRKPFGPGWVLVGDAGFTKDPITAQGISNAFVDAERVANGLHAVWANGASFDEQMAGYQAERDDTTLPTYEFTIQMATLEPPPAEVQQLLAAIAGNQPAMDDYVSVLAGTMSPLEFFAPENLEQVFAAAGQP
jgi:2-polyprenyl-6-methoxyphenol hydroxylase-like FAD-dependent oxidoreductase